MKCSSKLTTSYHQIWPLLLVLWSFSMISHANGTILGPSGPSCTVTSIIPNKPTAMGNSKSGVCYSPITCRTLGGIPIGKCGAANVCCVFPRTCDGITSLNGTYFMNPSYPFPFNGTLNCQLTIHKMPNVFRICQLRFDFLDFDLKRPNVGSCDDNRFMISGVNSNSFVPNICGYNTGQHIYADVDSVNGPFTVHINTRGEGLRRWNILISQIECLNPSKAPSNCLQYYQGPSGTFTSFNYEMPNIREDTTYATQQTSDATRFSLGYINNLDYAICFRKETGFCSITYRVNTSQTLFDIIRSGETNGNDNSGRVGMSECPQDYILLNGLRYCGRMLGSTGQDIPVTDASNGPVVARFHSDGSFNARGFKLEYYQNPCGAFPSVTDRYVQGQG